jgi:hypothetical protein
MTASEKPTLLDAIHRASYELHQLEMFVSICVQALDKSTQALQMLEVAQRLAKQANLSDHILSEEDLAEVKKRVSKFEEFAKQQKDDGFPFLFGLAVVRLWSILEALIDGLVVDFLRKPDTCKDKELIYSLKGPLLEFMTASPDQQADFLTERLKDAVKAGLQPGIGRFEAMLDPIGLGGGIDTNVRRVLFELSQVRNAIVHKGGITDKRFVENCSWLDLKVGAPLKINSNDFHLYTMSTYYYAVELRRRIQIFLGHKNQQDLIDLLSESAEAINKFWSDRNGTNKQKVI